MKPINKRLEDLEQFPFIFPNKIRPLIEEIDELKVKRNAVILAHNYQTPDIFYGVADITGDSLALAREAMTVDADVIVLAGVHFMAETAKLMNPKKTVLIPDIKAGCSLAESITPEDVRKLKAEYPGVPVVTYVNTTAAVKAECDITCTSGNAVKIVESLGVPRVIVVPDEYLADWIQTETNVEIIKFSGHCEVHEQFTPAEIRGFRDVYADLKVIAHPECPEAVLNESDFVGSTAKMIEYVQNEKPERVMLVTECSMSDNVSVTNPEVEFIRPCHLCPHMKKITLEKIRDSLLSLEPKVEIPEGIALKARLAVERMLDVK